MKQMKKLLSLILAIALCAGLAAPVFAAGEDANVAIPFKYTGAKSFSEGLAAVELDGKWGYIDRTGKEVVPIKYDEAYDFEDGIAAVKIGKLYGFIDSTGKELTQFKYSQFCSISEGLIAVDAKVREYGGLVNGTSVYGTPAVLHNYDETKDISNLWYGAWGFIDKTGKEVVPCKYERVGSFSEGLAVVEVDSGEKNDWGGPIYKYGFVDTTGKEVTPCKYDKALYFCEGLAAVGVTTDETNAYGEEIIKYGYIDRTGKEVIPLEYYGANNFFEGRATVYKDSGEVDEASNKLLMAGVIDKSGNEVTRFFSDPYMSTDISIFVDGVACLVSDSMDGNSYIDIIDSSGEILTNQSYQTSSHFSEGLLQVYLVDYLEDGDVWRYGFIDKTGKEVVPCQYREVNDFSEGLARVIDEDYMLYGFIDKTGKEVIPFEYYMAQDFSHGIAAVAKRTYDDGIDDLISTFGFIDKTGKEVVPFKYSYAGKIWEHPYAGKDYCLALVGVANRQDASDWKWGFVDETGKEVVPCKYDDFGVCSEGLVPAMLDGKWGYLSLESKSIAYASTQSVLVNGVSVEFQCYALKDENGYDTNYVKIRDLANVLNGTAAQFSVDWDGSVRIETNKAYTPNGSEMSTPYSGDRDYEKINDATMVNGKPVYMDCIKLRDDNGGGYTYYKLRDLGEALGFKVDWTYETGIFIETK